MSKAQVRSLLSVAAMLLCASTLQAIDIFNFYRAPFFFGAPRQDHRDGTSYLDVRWGHGKTDRGFDRNQNRPNILGIYGLTDVSLLASNVPHVSEACTPLTHKYLDPETGIIPGFNFKGSDGKISLRGTFDIDEFNLIYQQNLRYGFYFMAYIPFRDIKVYDVSIDNFTCTANEHFEDFQEFLSSGTFDQVLCENGIKSACTPFMKSGISDPGLYLGFQGYDDHAFDFFRDIAAFVQTGIIFPLASGKQRKILTSVPLGYDDSVAWSTRFSLEVGFADLLAVGVNGGVDIVWSNTRVEQIKTDLCQTGLIYLGREEIEMLPGLVWGAGAFVHFAEPIKGLHIIGAYSYGKRDRTRVDKVRCDDLPLSASRPRSCECGGPELEPANSDCTCNNWVVPLTKRETIKEDTRLHGWQHHSVHILATYDTRGHFDYAPLVTFEYDFPIEGTRTFATDMIGGTAGLTLAWGW